MYTVDYFIQKFDAIPENNWCVRTRAKDGYQRCAVGWCYPTYQEAKASECDFKSNQEEKSLIELFQKLGYDCYPAQINNGLNMKYQQSTPKQRVLAALYDIKNIQTAQVKEVIKYVAVDAEIRESAKEMIEEEMFS